MLLMNLENINKSYGTNIILDQVDFTINDRERLGLIGVNGAGKTTLLKIIMGELTADSGTITFAKSLSIGYLAQNSWLESEGTIWEEMLTPFATLIELEQNIRQLERKISTENLQDKRYDQLLAEYGELTRVFEDQGGFSYPAKIRTLLSGFGFSEETWNMPIKSFSGGEKTRLAMVKLLLTEPQLLILDEPTNHLDLKTLAWLEDYLQSYNGAILVVSHDRTFLDKLVTRIYALENHSCKSYTGNYTTYQKQKEAEKEELLKEYEKQQSERKRLEEFVQKNIARASTTKRAESRRKQLEKMVLIEKPKEMKHLSQFTYKIERASGKEVLQVTNLSVGYKEKVIAAHLNFLVERGERIAIIGPNGIGKSTLLKTLINKLPPLTGEIRFGSQVDFAYYDQEQAILSSNKRVLDELWDEVPFMSEKEIRSLLGSFLFRGDDIEKQVSFLSGGEKARLSLAKLFLTRANFLLLDEPTNHLDLPSREILENALREYEGTLLFISHDRYFINRLATRTLELSADGARFYLGNYDYYLEKIKDNNQDAKKEQSSNHQTEMKSDPILDNYEQQKENKRQRRILERRLSEIEQKISQYEEELKELEGQALLPEFYTDHTKSNLLFSQIAEIKKQLESCYKEWEEVSLQL